MRDSFVFYRSYYEAIELLPKSQRADAYRAIFEFMFNGNDITDELPNTAKAIFLMAKPTLEANNKKYEAGKKGAETKKTSKSKANDEQPTKQSGSKEEATYQAKREQSGSKEEATLQANDKQNGSNVNVNVNVNENENVNENVKKDTPKPPTETLTEKCKNDSACQMLLSELRAEAKFADELINYRHELGKPFKTVAGVRGALKEFVNTARDTSKSANELLEIMREREWLTIRTDYLQNRRQKINHRTTNVWADDEDEVPFVDGVVLEMM